MVLKSPSRNRAPMDARRQEMDSRPLLAALQKPGAQHPAPKPVSSATGHDVGTLHFLYISGEFGLKYKASYVLRYTAEALPTAPQHDSRTSGCRRHVPCHLKVVSSADPR